MLSIGHITKKWGLKIGSIGSRIDCRQIETTLAFCCSIDTDANTTVKETYSFQPLNLSLTIISFH